MSVEQYELTSSPDLTRYRFKSIGPQGVIQKVIGFSPTETPGVFNLGFGDEDPVTGEISDTVVSDNKDMDKVLVTVAAAALLFTDKYPQVILYFKGSNATRTALYQRKILRYHEEISELFTIYGKLGTDYVVVTNEHYYDHFLVVRKK
jgi:hypothetical protein